MNYQAIKDRILGSSLDELLIKLNSNHDLVSIKKRYLKLLDETYKQFGDGDYCLISASGRSEIGGNHTDHQHGLVIGAAVNMDNISFIKKRSDLKVNYYTQGFDMKSVDLNNLEINEHEKHTSEALIRGIAYRFKELGYRIGGFEGMGQCNVLMGSGISSSASFEVLICQIFNHLYNDGQIDDITIAKISQYAENHYFMKPCGLLDQMTISVGGFVFIDFKDPNNPKVEKIDFDFKDYGYNLVLVNTKGDHAHLSDEYAAIPKEIKQVAAYFEKPVISEVTLDQVLNSFNVIRDDLQNDRALLRSIHVLNENKRVLKEVEALKNKDINTLLSLIKESGNSSYKFLQNISVSNNPYKQNIALALALSENILTKGATRVHGGGFEGTIQAIVADDELDKYIDTMAKYFGSDALYVVNIRPYGGYRII